MQNSPLMAPSISISLASWRGHCLQVAESQPSKQKVHQSSTTRVLGFANPNDTKAIKAVIIMRHRGEDVEGGVAQGLNGRGSRISLPILGSGFLFETLNLVSLNFGLHNASRAL